MRLNKEEEDEGGSEVQTPDNKKFPENPNDSSNSPEQALETTLENLSHTRNGNKLEQEIDGANCKHDSEIGDLNPDNELKQFANLYVDDGLAPNSGNEIPDSYIFIKIITLQSCISTIDTCIVFFIFFLFLLCLD
jgi:hypothetical protein